MRVSQSFCATAGDADSLGVVVGVGDAAAVAVVVFGIVITTTFGLRSIFSWSALTGCGRLTTSSERSELLPLPFVCADWAVTCNAPFSTRAFTFAVLPLGT